MKYRPSVNSNFRRVTDERPTGYRQISRRVTDTIGTQDKPLIASLSHFHAFICERYGLQTFPTTGYGQNAVDECRFSASHCQTEPVAFALRRVTDISRPFTDETSTGYGRGADSIRTRPNIEFPFHGRYKPNSGCLAYTCALVCFRKFFLTNTHSRELRFHRHLARRAFCGSLCPLGFHGSSTPAQFARSPTASRFNARQTAKFDWPRRIEPCRFSDRRAEVSATNRCQWPSTG